MVLLITLGCVTSVFAQNQNASFREITEKFSRNMTLLTDYYTDPDVKEAVKTVAEKAKSLASLYASGGAKGVREKLIREKEALDKKTHMDQSDMDRLNKLQKDINAADPDGSFKTGRTAMEASVRRLEGILKNVDVSTDPDKANLVTLTLRHLQVYRAAMRLGDN